MVWRCVKLKERGSGEKSSTTTASGRVTQQSASGCPTAEWRFKRRVSRRGPRRRLATRFEEAALSKKTTKVAFFLPWQVFSKLAGGGAERIQTSPGVPGRRNGYLEVFTVRPGRVFVDRAAITGLTAQKPFQREGP